MLGAHAPKRFKVLLLAVLHPHTCPAADYDASTKTCCGTGEAAGSSAIEGLQRVGGPFMQLVHCWITQVHCTDHVEVPL